MRCRWLTLGLLLIAGCGSAGSAIGKAEVTMAKGLVSDEDENRIGQEVHRELDRQHVKYLQDPVVIDYLQSVTKPIFACAKRDRPGVRWQLYVIDDPKTMNAFSAPGGGLYVYSGLLGAADDDAEVAGVLGHEVGHEVLHHVAEKLIAENGLEAIASLALGANPSLLGRIGTAIVGNGALLAFSRNEESQADEYGADVAASAGFNPNGLVWFFQKLERKRGEEPGILRFLSDHPTTPDRIEAVSALIRERHLPNADTPPSTRVLEIRQRVTR
jgi:predicted Zn-dependent protease